MGKAVWKVGGQMRQLLTQAASDAEASRYRRTRLNKEDTCAHWCHRPYHRVESGSIGLRDFVQAAEDLGYAHIRMLDHVLGADPKFHPEVPEFFYTHESYIHEPLTLMSYLAAITTRLQLATAILILPQRQTALVAKQAAEVDVLSGGRLRLGIGVGWNPVEYEALGEDFHNRGRRCEEQIAVLRTLWTQEVVNFQGRWHRITHAGLNPLPVQRPIPIWIGAGCPQPSAARRRPAPHWSPCRWLDPPVRTGRAWARNHRTGACVCPRGGP